MGFDALGPRQRGSDLVNVLIDTPRGSGNKYKLDEELGVFRVSRLLPTGMHFPYDFGSIPGTRSEDGDPLDVLVLMEAPTFPGCLLTVRLIGVLRAEQRESRKWIRNDRLLAVPQTPVNEPQTKTLAEVPQEILSGIEQFFSAYNRAQGREFRLKGRGGPAEAERMLRRAERLTGRR